MESGVVVSLWVWVVLGVLVVLVALVAWLDRLGRRYVPDRRPSGTRAIETADGWRLTADVYRPAEGVPLQEAAVVLCHGLGATAEGVDLAPDASFARALVDQGYVVLVARLRGRRGTLPPKGTRRHAYGFLDHALRDGPAILQAALDEAGKSRAFWIGHSMGGLVGYVVASNHPEQVAGLVTVGSPAGLEFKGLLRWIAWLGWYLSWLPLGAVPLERLARLGSPLMRARYAPPLLGSTTSRPNLPLPATRALLAHGVADLPLRLGRELLAWGIVRGPEPRRDAFEAALKALRVPLLCIAGTDDRIAPPETVEAAIHRAGSADKSYWLIDGEGLPAAPGHVDLVAGIPAAKVVIPRVMAWMAARVPGRAPPPASPG